MFNKILFLILVFISLFKANPVLADFRVAGESSSLKIEQIYSDYRVAKLRDYLRSQNSPLVEYAEDFVSLADKYNLDWRLIPAITGVESTFGKRIPYKSFNAYGWAGGEYRFTSWQESIEVVSKSLKEDYIEKGAPSLTKIGRRYCPPNPAWSGKVKFFMNKIEALPLTFDLEG